MKVSDYIAEFLEYQGVDCVFEMAGGMITHLLDSLYKRANIKIISLHHEQAASFAADAFGRVKGIPGVALATSGPGATNLLTGIGSCYFDSSPAIFITGQVNTYELKGNKPIRQLGFQETDIVKMALPITKAVFQIKNKKEVVDIFNKAFKIALNGRPGPVLIDIPMDIQRMEIKNINIENNINKNKSNKSDVKNKIKYLLSDINNSQKPLILAGRGIRSSFSYNLFKKFINRTNIPVVTSLLGLDSIPFNHKSRVGFIGSYGNRWANIALGECDLIIVLGSRLDIRQTGADTLSFAENKKIYHIDCEKGEINNRIPNCVKIELDINCFFHNFLEISEKYKFKKFNAWINNINKNKNKFSDIYELKDIKGINPNYFIHQMCKKSKDIRAYISDVGNNQMWLAQSLELNKNQLFISSGGMGAMGFALPASIGVTFALNKKPVLAIAGDGGFQLNIQELQTVIHHHLPVKIIIFNNHVLGMIRQFQDSYFGSRYQSTYWGYSAPDFAMIAKAYGIQAITINAKKQIEESINWLLRDLKEPALLQVMVDLHTNAYPKLAFGKPITEMEPDEKPLAMEEA